MRIFESINTLQQDARLLRLTFAARLAGNAADARATAIISAQTRQIVSGS